MESSNREQFYTRLFSAFQSMQKSIVPKSTAFDKSLPLSQRVMMFTISIHGPTSVKHLSNVLQITSGAVTQTVDALVRAGLVDRTVNEIDRRGVSICLSQQGTDLIQELNKDMMQIMSELFSAVSDEELKELVRIYEKIGSTKKGGK